MVLKKEIGYWMGYFEMNNMEWCWRKLIKEIDNSKPSELPLFKEVFYKTFVDNKPSLDEFYNYLKHDKKIKMMQEIVSNKLDYVKINFYANEESKKEMWFWCMIARPFLGFWVEHRLKEELIKRGLNIEDTEELDNKYKVDLKISIAGNVAGIQLKNITFMYGFVKNNGYGNIHSRGLYNFAINEMEVNPTEKIGIGFLFYTFYDKEIVFHQIADTQCLVAHPLEIMECKKVGIIKDYKIEEVADFIADTMNSSSGTIASGQDIK